MEPTNFQYQEGHRAGLGTYTAVLDGFQVEIPEQIFSKQSIATALQIRAAYPERLRALAEFCEASECFQLCYPDETADSIMAKLHIPILNLDQAGGLFTYCNHEMDQVHLLEIEFTGVMEKFLSVDIDG